MKRRLLALLSALTIMVVAIAGTGVFAVTAETVSNSEWFANAKYGISVSIKHASQNNPESDASGGAQTSWENCVNEFDVDNFVSQVVQTGASYVLLCINQADEYFSAPNQAYADLIATSGMDLTDVMPTRDLPMEIMDALAEKGIKTMMYYAGDGPWKNEEVFENVFGGEIDDETKAPVLNPGGNDYATKTIKKNWKAVMEEYAARYGTKIAGWWLDGFDTSKWSLLEQKTLRAMLKKYNSDALISFNAGGPWRAPGYNVVDEGKEGADDPANILIDGSVDDYAAGEHHTFDSYPDSQYVVDKKGAQKQWHILSYLCGDPYVDGVSGRTVMDADYMIEYVKAVAEKKGVVTMDVTVGRTGNILSNELNVLKAINKAIYGVGNEPETPDEDETLDSNYQIIQDYEGDNNGAWGHAGFVDGAVNQTPTTKDPAGKQAPMSGFGSFYSEIMQDYNSGSDFLIANAADMECKLENPTGIFFRLKTNRKADTTMFLSTLGSASNVNDQEHGWCGNSNADYSIMNAQCNELATSARYYGLDGSYQTVGEDGRVVPAEFEGYVFIPFDVASKNLEGLTIMYAQSWALSGSYPGTIGNWYGTNPTTIVGFDNVGYYTGNTVEDHRAIIAEVEGQYVSYEYEILQDYEGENNGDWGHAPMVEGAVNATPITIDPNTKQPSLSGMGTFYSEITNTSAGSDYLIKDAADMRYDLKNPTGIFFRLKTNRNANTTMFLSTIGGATELTDAHGWGGNNNADYALMNYQSNNDCIKTKYIALDGTDMTVDGDGRVVPANFDGYVFIPVDLSAKILDGLTIMYAPNWALTGSYSGTIANWYGADPITRVAIDNVGVYTAYNNAAYKALIDAVESKYVSYEYEIIQDYEGENNGSWGHAGYVNGDVNQTPITTDPAVQNVLSGFGSFSTQINGFDAGSDYLIANAADMEYTMKNPMGIFFRLKTNRAANTTMYLSTVGAATEVTDAHGWAGNNNADYSLMNHLFNNACLNTKYIALDGTDMTVDGDGRVVPANFDGYVFVPFDVTTKSIEGLTIMYAQNWALTGSYNGTIAGWYGGEPNVVSFDNVGYYAAGTSAAYKDIVNAVEGSYKSYAYDIFQSYETSEEQANAAAAGSIIVGGDGAGMTNRYVTEGQIGGKTSRELYFIGNNYGGDYLVMNAPASELSKPAGIYVRVKTNAVKDLLFTLYPTTGKEDLSWPNSAQPVKYYNLDGELVYTSKYVMPAGFDGYAFIPTGDIAGQAIAAQLLPTWYGNAYAANEMTNVGHAWVAGPGGGVPSIYFDNIGYYAAATDADFAAIIADLNAKYGVKLPDVEFDLFQGYETDEQRANAAANGAITGCPDSDKLANRLVTENTLSGNVSRELYWHFDGGSGADYLVLNAPASKLEKTTGFYVRMKTNTTAVTAFKVMATADNNTDGDNKIGEWHADSIAAKFYNLKGELVMTSNNLCPAGFDGYIFIPSGDVQGKAIAVMLLAAWFGEAYTPGSNPAQWWIAGPDAANPTILFDDIGYYYTPNQDDAQYAKLINKLKAPAVNEDVSASFEIVQDYETKGSNANAGGAPFGQDGKWNEDGSIWVFRATEEQANAGLVRPLSGGNSYHTRLVDGVRGSDYLIKDLAAPTIADADGIFLRLNTGHDRTVSLCLTSAGADSVVNAETGELTSGFLNGDYELTRPVNNAINTAVRYYSLDGELVGTGLAVPAGFDGYVFVPVDLSTKKLDGLTANWVDGWYGEAETYWHNSDTIVRVDNIGYYSVSSMGLDSEYAAIIGAVEGSYKCIDDKYRDFFGLIAEARGFDLTTGLGADLKADFDAAITNIASGAHADSVLYEYKMKVGTLGNPLRLNVGGAQIRESDNALRFILEADQSFLDYMNERYTNVEFGTLLARADLYSGEMVCSAKKNGFSKKEATTIMRESTFTLTEDEYKALNGSNTLVYTCVLRGVPADKHDVVLRARNYIKFTDGDTEYVVYGEEINTTYAEVLAQSAQA